MKAYLIERRFINANNQVVSRMYFGKKDSCNKSAESSLKNGYYYTRLNLAENKLSSMGGVYRHNGIFYWSSVICYTYDETKQSWSIDETKQMVDNI